MNLPFQQAATTGINKKYDDLVADVKSSISPFEKASHIHALFKALQEDRLGFYDLFQNYQLPELQAAIAPDDHNLTPLCKAGNIYYCPQDDRGIKTTYNEDEAFAQWEKELSAVEQWNLSQAYTNAYGPKAPENI